MEKLSKDTCCFAIPARLVRVCEGTIDGHRVPLEVGQAQSRSEPMGRLPRSLHLGGFGHTHSGALFANQLGSTTDVRPLEP
jgi:hypothetical protein